MASEPTPSFGDLLRRQRKAAGLTQAELGERTFAAAVQEGGALSLEEVVAEALEGDDVGQGEAADAQDQKAREGAPSAASAATFRQ